MSINPFSAAGSQSENRRSNRGLARNPIARMCANNVSMRFLLSLSLIFQETLRRTDGPGEDNRQAESS